MGVFSLNPDLFQQPNPFCCNRSTTNLFKISFLSRTQDFSVNVCVVRIVNASA
jgi:hypothetical protein